MNTAVLAILLWCAVIIFFIVAYGTFRCRRRSFTDPFSRTLFPKRFRHFLDGWGLFHFIFYALLTHMFPQYWLLIFGLGVSWEFIESLTKSHPFYLSKCNIHVNTDQQSRWWYGRYQDVIMNTLGQMFGYYMYTKGYSWWIYVPMYAIVILSHLIAFGV
jgi:hypothetical protein